MIESELDIGTSVILTLTMVSRVELTLQHFSSRHWWKMPGKLPALLEARLVNDVEER